MKGGVLRASLIPFVVVSSCVWGALGSDGFWRTLCIAILGALAFGFWVTLTMFRWVDEKGWPQLAKDATMQSKLNAEYARDLAAITAVATGELRKYDEAGARLIGQQLLDVTARYEELT